jgi:hypothetical protein
MRTLLVARLAVFGMLTVAGVAVVALIRGQTPRPLPADIKAPAEPVGAQPVSGSSISPSKLASPPSRPRLPVVYDRLRQIETLPELPRQMVVATMQGVEWLSRYNQPNGLFLYGYLPALNVPLEGENLLHQAQAAFALARAARFTGDDALAARATQSCLTLLSLTTVDASGARRPVQPSIVCNRLALAGTLAMAVYELPDPAADLLSKADELVAFIQRQQRDDGSLNASDDKSEANDAESVNQFSGPGAAALAMSQRVRPSPAKADALRRCVGFYRRWFREHPSPEMIPSFTAACAEGYQALKENAFAEFAMEMNDWLTSLQYVDAPDPRRPLWRGGFKSHAKGRLETTAPGIEAAYYARSFADACRLIRLMPSPDLQRHDRYRAALTRSLQFMTTLQFTEANAQHLSAGYRAMVVGGFHPTHQDGNLRIDQGAAAVSAFVQFFVCGADRAQ